MNTNGNNSNQLYEFIKIPSHNNITGRFSCFAKGLMYAREATDRDPKTGKKKDAAKHLNIAGVLGYFALLEQIGNCFIPTSITDSTNKTNNTHKALHYFSLLNSKKIYVIRALRNTFSHDFSLYNVDKRNSKLIHHFKFVFSDTDSLISDTEPLMILSKEDWDGDLSTKNENNITIVNLEKLCELIDKICVNIQEMANRNELKIVLNGGFNEYYDRYSINYNCNLKFKFTSNTLIKTIQIKK